MPLAMWTEEEQGRTNALIGGRKENTDKYKPGVKAMYLVGGCWDCNHRGLARGFHGPVCPSGGAGRCNP